MSTQWYDPDSLLFAVGIEDTFIAQEYPGRRKLDEYEMTQHNQFWHSDLGLAAEAGARAIRWGIPWYRVNPERGEFDFSWIDRVADRFEEVGLTPIIDLMHYGTPLWLERSFDDPDYPKLIAEYAAAVAERYRDRFTVFTPLNEPLLNVIYCGEFGIWPPHQTGDAGFARLLGQIGEGIVRTQAAIADVTADSASFVHVEASYRFSDPEHSAPELVEFLRNRAFIVEDLVTGRVDDAHPLVGWLRSNGFSDDALAWHAENVAIPDVMGVNYYPQVSTEAFSPGAVQPSGSLEDPRPRVDHGTTGLEEVLLAFWNRYERPVMVSETSVGGTPAERIEWMDASISTVHRLRDRGVPVVGYTWWAVFDWFTWDYREETKPLENYLCRNGLWDLEIDAAGVFQRTRTAAVDRFRHHATEAAS